MGQNIPRAASTLGALEAGCHQAESLRNKEESKPHPLESHFQHIASLTPKGNINLYHRGPWRLQEDV